MTSNFDKFTPRARKVLSLSQQESERLNHPYIGTEHLLLGLVREGEGIAARVLTDMGVQLPEARSAVESIIGREEGAVMGEVGLTPRAKKVIELSVDEARRLDHSYIGTEHVLLGLLREIEGHAVGILESLGVDAVKVRQQVMQMVEQSARARVADASTELPGQLPVRADIERLETEIVQARAEGNRHRVRDLEARLALIHLKELDKREQRVTKQLIVEEKRSIAIDDEVRRLLAELDQLKKERSGHIRTLFRAERFRNARKKRPQPKGENDPEDRPSAQE
ncbi:MAG TPA: Clp protease N-terminal domain-containing protein [Thermomicrobiales bacterium]|nr:Clp protease N-terminal domain-containing protein [Thermomicrobiales bacterium]